MPAASKTTKRKTNQHLVEIKITIGHRIDGKRIQKSFYGSTKREARAKADAFLEQEKRGELIARNLTFAQWAEEWLQTYIKGQVGNSTYYDNYERPVRLHLIPAFGPCQLSTILPKDVKSFLNKKSSTLKHGYVQKIKVCLGQIFEAAVENDLCLKNPVTKNVKIKPEDPADRPAKRCYSLEEIKLVVDFARTHEYGLDIIVMILTGVGRSELLGLQWADVTPDYVLHVRRGVTEQKNPETGKYELVVSDKLKNVFRRRDIPISKELYDLIMQKPRVIFVGGNEKRREAPQPVITTHIFHNKSGGVWYPHNWSNRPFKQFMGDMVNFYKEQDIDLPALTPHELRHTAASAWANSQVDLFTIAKLGGWCDLKMLAKRYGHPDVEVMRNALGYEKPALKKEN